MADAIRFARRSGLQIAVRGGGHSYAGHSACDGVLFEESATWGLQAYQKSLYLDELSDR